MVRAHSSSAEDRGFKSWSVKTKDYKIWYLQADSPLSTQH